MGKAKGGSHYRARKVVDRKTNKVYPTVQAAAKAKGVNKYTLSGYLNDVAPNKTSLQYLQ